MDNYTDSSVDSKPTNFAQGETPTERLLRSHGIDPHAVIPVLAETMTYEQVAEQLSRDSGEAISRSWVSWWINYHYDKVRRWVRKVGA